MSVGGQRGDEGRILQAVMVDDCGYAALEPLVLGKIRVRGQVSLGWCPLEVCNWWYCGYAALVLGKIRGGRGSLVW